MGKRLLGVTVAASLVLAACGSDQAESGTETTAPVTTEAAVPETTPEPESRSIVNTIDGGQVDLAEVIEQDAVLWFWAPW